MRLTFIPVVIDNYRKANEGKCHVLQSTNGNVLVNICTTQIQSSTFEKY